ncbi:MAG: LEA type 2 family protein [Woeseiaceae bacterium]
MRTLKLNCHCLFFLTIILLASCATTRPSIQPPAVTLTSVELDSIGMGAQSFLLGFSVSNPNPFPLPVKSIRYDILLDNQKFAGGETQGDFVVSARGDGKFVIDVELDLLQTVSQLRSLLAGAMRETVEYELQGSLAVDIPFARPIPFSNSGVVRVRDGS